MFQQVCLMCLPSQVVSHLLCSDRNDELQYVAMSRLVLRHGAAFPVILIEIQVYNSIQNHLQMLSSSEFSSVKVVTWYALDSLLRGS